MIEQVFVHIDPDTGKQTSYLSERINRAALKSKLVPVLIDVEQPVAEMFVKDRGVENHRLARITPRHLKNFPVILLEMPDGSHLLIDGTHRYVKAFIFGKTHIKAYMVPEEIWKHYTINDVPKLGNDFFKSFSGIH